MKRICPTCGGIHEIGQECAEQKRRRQEWLRNHGGYKREHDKLRSTYAWTQKAAQVKAEANWLCERCRRRGRYIHKDIEVHHIEKLADRPDLLLDDANLVVLCQSCHKAADAGEIPKDELRAIAAERNGSPPGV